MFKGFPNKLIGADVDKRHISWIKKNLDYIEAVHSKTRPPLPFLDNEFEAVISISVFSHLNEKSQNEFLSELFRITKPEGFLFLTIHGDRSLERAKNEIAIYDMLSVDDNLFKIACDNFSKDRYAFILQQGHLTKNYSCDNATNISNKYNKDNFYEYGISFIPKTYIFRHWSEWFEVLAIHSGAIHDSQDIVILKPKK
jgi:ubiquinone/menaquinone biosynthesis C-methylase UbiE